MTLSSSTPKNNYRGRRDSGFVGLQETDNDVHQKAEIGGDVHQKAEIENVDSAVAIQGRRQSRMFSIDYDFMVEDEEQDRVVKKYTQIGISFAADLSLFAYGSCFSMSSVVLPQIEQASDTDLTISSEEGSWFVKLPLIYDTLIIEILINTTMGWYFLLASVFVIGSITGALVGGITGEKLGRKPALIIDNIIMMLEFYLSQILTVNQMTFGFISFVILYVFLKVFWMREIRTNLSSFAYMKIGLLCIALPHQFPLMLVGRYLCGHACSSIQVVAPSYTSEISQPLIRPLTSYIFIVIFICGSTIMSVIGALVPWHIAVSITLIWPLLSLICVISFCPESPVWLLIKGKDDRAEKSLMLLRGDEKIVQNEIKRIKTALMELEIAMTDGGEQRSGLMEVLDLFTDNAFLKPFGILLFLYVFTVNWGGTPSLSFYMIILLQKSNFHYDSYIMAAGLSVFRALVIILSSGFTSKMRRRPLFLTCGVFHLIGMGTIGIYNFLNENGRLEKMSSFAEWIPIIAILLIYSFSTVGYVSMVFMLTPEILPSNARAIGCGLVGFFDNISLALSIKMIPTLLDSIDVSGIFTLYAILTLFALIFSYFFLPETYGLGLDEIERIFRGSKKSDASDLELQQAVIRKGSVNRLRSNSVLSLYETSSQYTR